MSSPSPAGGSQPLVSVVVPVYNGAPYLGETLDSLLAQTYPALEILVFDDASTDETPEVIARYGSRIRAVRQRENRGIYANANDGIAAAAGELIAVYHADDIYEPEIVEREVAFLQRHPDAGAVFCLDTWVDAGGRPYGRLELPPDLRDQELLPYPAVLDGMLRYKNRFLMCPGAMVRAAVYREVGPYRPDLFRNTSDLEMWLRIARKHPLGLLHEYLFRYRHFHGNSSQRYHHLRVTPENFFGIVDRYLQEGEAPPPSARALRAYEGHRAEDFLRIGVNAYIRGDLAAARAALRRCRAGRVLRGENIQRARLLALLLGFRLLARLPRWGAVAELMRRRWYDRGPPA